VQRMPDKHVLPLEATSGIGMTELARNIADFFPYAEVRPFQDQFIKTVFSAVEEGCSVAVEGSNGLGKPSQHCRHAFQKP